MEIKPYQIIGGCFGLLAVVSFLAFNLSNQWKVFILSAWAVVPPIYFFFELHWVRKNRPSELENCKLSQESASKIWAGVAAALALVFFGKP